MIVLDATTKSLEVVLSGAVTTNQLPVVASYVEVTDSDQSVSDIAENDTATNNTTAVTAVAAPAAGKTRVIKSLTVQNADTVAATITVRLNNNSTMRTLCKVTINAGEQLQYASED